MTCRVNIRCSIMDDVEAASIKIVFELLYREFVSWNNEQWTAWIHDDAFEQTPQAEGYWHRHSNPSLAFIDWEGEPWQAKIDGETFLLAHRGEWNEPTESATAIRYRDWSGRKQLRTLAQLTR